METREDDLDELAINLSTAIAKARQLKLPASPYILSMAPVKEMEATRASRRTGRTRLRDSMWRILGGSKIRRQMILVSAET
jgi:hypothetical protein